MNAPDPLAREKFAELLAATREPFPASRKAYLPGQLHPDLRVPVRVDLVNPHRGERATESDTQEQVSTPRCTERQHDRHAAFEKRPVDCVGELLARLLTD